MNQMQEPKPRRVKASILLLLLITVLACNRPPSQPVTEKLPGPSFTFSSLNWLVGEWENNSEGNLLIERWQKANDSLFNGISYMIISGDTVFNEVITLKMEKGVISYIPKVSDQNQGQEIPFILAADSAGILVFENPDHDFPQKIYYSHPHADSLVAWIEGKSNGVFRKEIFRMRKKS